MESINLHLDNTCKSFIAQYHYIINKLSKLLHLRNIKVLSTFLKDKLHHAEKDNYR